MDASSDSSFLIDSSATLPSMGRVKDRTEYGQRVLAARRHANLSQVALGQRVGLGQTSITHLETVAHSSNKTTEIAQACGVSALWLATGKGPMVDAADARQRPPLQAGEAVAPYAIAPNAARDYRTVAHTVAAALAEAGLEVTVSQFLSMVDAAFQRLNPS